MKSKYNFVIIGKSGVGKSSLINYFFNKEVAKTGAGAPITEKKFELYKKEDTDQIVQIYDSWGIEGGKTTEWLDFFKDFMDERKGTDVSKWINTAIYCISGESNRIEEYDKKIIKVLVEEELSPIIVITKSDADFSGKFIDVVRQEFPKLDVIAITSVKQSIGLGVNKKTVETKGIELLKEAMVNNSLNTFYSRLLFVKNEILKHKWKEAPIKIGEIIGNFIDNYNSCDRINKNELPELTNVLQKKVEDYNTEVENEIGNIILSARTSFLRFKNNNYIDIPVDLIVKERINKENDKAKQVVLSFFDHEVKDFLNFKFLIPLIGPYLFFKDVFTYKKNKIKRIFQNSLDEYYSNLSK